MDSAFLELKHQAKHCRKGVNLLYVQRYSKEGREADFPARAAGPDDFNGDESVAAPKKPRPGRSRWPSRNWRW